MSWHNSGWKYGNGSRQLWWGSCNSSVLPAHRTPRNLRVEHDIPMAWLSLLKSTILHLPCLNSVLPDIWACHPLSSSSSCSYNDFSISFSRLQQQINTILETRAYYWYVPPSSVPRTSQIHFMSSLQQPKLLDTEQSTVRKKVRLDQVVIKSISANK